MSENGAESFKTVQLLWCESSTSGETDFGKRSRLPTAFHNSNEEVEAAIHE
jgi:hypothetical protein